MSEFAKYQQQDWDKNCVMFALSKVLSISTNALARYIVDHNIGGVTMASQMENGTVIKQVLGALGFVSLMEGGAKWSKMKLLVGSYGITSDSNGKLVETMYFDTNGYKKYTHETKARFYGVYWRHKGKEEWTDKSVQPGLSDHAFAIFVAGPTISIPPTNDPTFEAQHSPPQDDDFISVFRPTRTITG